MKHNKLKINVLLTGKWFLGFIELVWFFEKLFWLRFVGESELIFWKLLFGSMLCDFTFWVFWVFWNFEFLFCWASPYANLATVFRSMKIIIITKAIVKVCLEVLLSMTGEIKRRVLVAEFRLFWGFVKCWFSSFFCIWFNYFGSQFSSAKLWSFWAAFLKKTDVLFVAVVCKPKCNSVWCYFQSFSCLSQVFFLFSRLENSNLTDVKRVMCVCAAGLHETALENIWCARH